MKASCLKLLLLPLIGTLLASAHHASATVMFFEGFENPVVGGPNVPLPTGTHNFDNANWEIINNDTIAPEFGVFLDNNSIFPGGDQVLAFGGGNDPGPNEASITLEGFTGLNIPEISFDHFGNGTGSQGIIVIVTDPNNGGNILYSSGNLFGNGSITNVLFSSAPVGDSIELTISQVGNSANSDSAIDNITITAIPESSTLLLCGLAGLAMMRRRRGA